MEPVDDESRQCGLSDDGLDAAVRIPVSNTPLKAVAESPFLLYVQTTSARKNKSDCTTMIQVSALRPAWFSQEPDAKSGMVVDANPYFSELTRYPRPEVVGKRFAELDAFLGMQPPSWC